MDAKKIRSRIVTGCLATILLPAGAGVAKSQIAPGLEPSSAAADRRFPIVTGGLFRAGVLGGAFAFGDLRGMAPDQVEAASGTAPWFRKTFELFQADVTPAAEPPAAARPEPANVQVPGVVQNLRRADRR
jgi:hypothetical protein